DPNRLLQACRSPCCVPTSKLCQAEIVVGTGVLWLQRDSGSQLRDGLGQCTLREQRLGELAQQAGVARGQATELAPDRNRLICPAGCAQQLRQESQRLRILG